MNGNRFWHITNRSHKSTYFEESDQQLIKAFHSLDEHLSDYEGAFIKLTSQSGAVFMLIQLLEKYVGERAYALSNALMAGKADLTSANHGYQLQRLAQQLKDDTEAIAVVLHENFNPKQWQTLLPSDSVFKLRDITLFL